MKTYIILLRGINVGGKNLLPMKALVSLLEEQSFINIKTHIQTGNVVLQSQSKPSVEFVGTIEKEFNFKPEIIIIEKSDFDSSVSKNPFNTAEGKSVHFYFCTEKPKVNKEKLDTLLADTEEYQLINNVFYLLAPNGIGRSKLVSNIEACLGVRATGRNLNTVNKLKQLSDYA